jgi:hypothetical protein
MDEIVASLNELSVPQYGLAFVFVASYALSIGAILGGRVRLFFGVLAAGSGGCFAFTMDPWFLGALLVAYAVIGMGLFIGVVWLASVLLSARNAKRSHVESEKDLPRDADQPTQQSTTDAWVS